MKDWTANMTVALTLRARAFLPGRRTAARRTLDLPATDAFQFFRHFSLIVRIGIMFRCGACVTNVCYWHKADIQLSPANVRFWG